MIGLGGGPMRPPGHWLANHWMADGAFLEREPAGRQPGGQAGPPLQAPFPQATLTWVLASRNTHHPEDDPAEPHADDHPQERIHERQRRDTDDGVAIAD